uniref:Uncharacterized protein n=1 Tax=Cyclophora tenuis TaxID=216820 RepID=A0A7S1GQF2_CYCTE|mmetsp:Transcript_4612/g.8001  ORF Transcript_4612/g.8001 Transcript_4612/m.8001 type:complete len:116 (+) Transcript_4612:3-350(+)
MDHYDSYAPYLEAMVLTDSTHNIQWLRNSTATPTCARLKTFLESDRCKYFRSHPDNDTEAGQPCTPNDTPIHWQHRFGQIATYWAGTTEHSLSDWHARHCIWNHFDYHLSSSSSP